MDALVQAVKQALEQNFENEKALLKLSEAIVERVVELEHRVEVLERIFNGEMKTQLREVLRLAQQNSDKVEMLHMLYHSRFGDDVVN